MVKGIRGNIHQTKECAIRNASKSNAVLAKSYKIHR